MREVRGYGKNFHNKHHRGQKASLVPECTAPRIFKLHMPESRYVPQSGSPVVGYLMLLYCGKYILNLLGTLKTYTIWGW
jgi:hypothetical protein